VLVSTAAAWLEALRAASQSSQGLHGAVSSYGYAGVALLVGVESFGVPLPGETTLVAAGIYAGTTHRLSLVVLVVVASAAAIIGDNIGYLIGWAGGYRLLRKYGRYIHVNESRLKLGHYAFSKHGGVVVFAGRFIAVLRTYAAFLAGTSGMRWWRFFAFNAAGGILWSTLYAVGSYYLGQSLRTVSSIFTYSAIPVVVIAVIAAYVFLKHNEARLSAKAEEAFPGPLDSYMGPALGLHRQSSS